MYLPPKYLPIIDFLKNWTTSKCQIKMYVYFFVFYLFNLTICVYLNYRIVLLLLLHSSYPAVVFSKRAEHLTQRLPCAFIALESLGSLFSTAVVGSDGMTGDSGGVRGCFYSGTFDDDDDYAGRIQMPSSTERCCCFSFFF